MGDMVGRQKLRTMLWTGYVVESGGWKDHWMSNNSDEFAYKTS